MSLIPHQKCKEKSAFHYYLTRSVDHRPPRGEKKLISGKTGDFCLPGEGFFVMVTTSTQQYNKELEEILHYS